MSRAAGLTIAVIAKECLPGKAKTRLTPPLSPVQSAGLAQTSLSQTLDTVRSLPAARRLLVFKGSARPEDAAGFEVLAQAPGGLDERLAGICIAADGPLLILGMDTPQFAVADLLPMFDDWSKPQAGQDAWLGLADDGGFWALALADPDPELIRGVPMSTAFTGQAQLNRLTEARLTVGRLPQLRDVDYFEDARYVAQSCPGSAFAAEVAALIASSTGTPAGSSGLLVPGVLR